jgi:hypothetical protein
LELEAIQPDFARLDVAQLIRHVRSNRCVPLEATQLSIWIPKSIKSNW